MPLFYQQNINATTQLAIWKIEEGEDFFLQKVPLQKAITHPHKRLQHLAGRYLLRYLFPDFPNHEILIADTRKPFLPDERYHFSISHCGGYAAAIVSTDKRVGIDIEIPTQRIATIRHKFLHQDELQGFHQLEEPDTWILTILWSAKEAMFKWWGLGEVDFSEMMQIEPFEVKQQGIINAVFTREEGFSELQLRYQLFEQICLVWVISETGHFFV